MSNRTEQLKTKRITYRSRFSDYELTETQIQVPPAPTQLIIRTTAIALNPIDVKLKSLAFVPWKYHVGRDFSGIVEYVGSAYQGKFAKGDRVCGIAESLNSAVGTYTVVDANRNHVAKAPESLSDQEAAAFPLTLGTAWGLINSAKHLQSDSRVVVLGGATSVGGFVLQILSKLKKVGTIVSVNSKKSDETALRFGATATIDYRSQNVAKELTEIAKRDGLFDYVFDTAGGTEVLHAHKDILKPASSHGGYYTIAGDAAPSSSYNSFLADTAKHLPSIAIRALLGNRIHNLDWKFATIAKTDWLEEARADFDQNGLTVLIDTVYPLNDFKKAIDQLTSVQAHGKIVIDMTKTD